MSLPSPEITGYPEWKAPAGDGEVLIWPDPPQLLQQIRSNVDRMRGVESARLLGVPLSDLRSLARNGVGHNDGGQPLIATGHQTELWHPGVWVKNAVIRALAARMDGRAYHFAVDTDTPKHLVFRWPGDAGPVMLPATDDPKSASAAWAGLVSAPTAGHVAVLLRELDAAAVGWRFSPVLKTVLESLSCTPAGTSLPQALSDAFQGLDRSLGLEYQAMLCSPVWLSRPYLMFAAYVLAEASSFCGDYNAALADYRQAHQMRSTTRPMPDLFITEQSVELPFWLDDLKAGTRSRPSVFKVGDKNVLKLVSGEEFEIDPRESGHDAAARLDWFLSQVSHRLAPRALTLTLYMRMFVADCFIHGIGGGRYDQVLDRLIRRHFDIPAPAFGVATATMHFPSAVGRQRACVPCVRQEGHRLKHAALGAEKQTIVRRISQLPARSLQRAAEFAEMQKSLRQAWATSSTHARWREKLESARAAESRDQVDFDRELFYGLQPAERLEQLIERVFLAFG